MRVLILAVGRMKNGTERELVQRYRDRIVQTGRNLGVTACDVVEIAESRASNAESRKREEAAALLAKLPSKSHVCFFDERGNSPSSEAFAEKFRTIQETGTDTFACIIGGADGLDSDIRARVDQQISFGALTIPHQIVRILVCEQIYRALTIIDGHPYHRE